MPECERYEEMISAYLDNELSPEEVNELTAHLQSCPACAALFNTYSLLFAKTAAVSAPAGFTASVMGMTSAVKAPQRAKKRAPIIRFFAAAAACLLLVGAAYPMVSAMMTAKGVDTAESAAQNSSVPFSLTTGAVSTTMMDSGVSADAAVVCETEAVVEESISESAKVASGAAPSGAVKDAVPEPESEVNAVAGTDTALLIIEEDSLLEIGAVRSRNAVYIYGELPESCRNLDFGEMAESNGTAFIAPIDEELANALILDGHEHDNGEILYLIWYPN